VGKRGVRSLSGEDIMARQRWAVGASLLLGLLLLTGAGQADEAAAVKAIEKLGGRVVRDDKLPGKPVVAVLLDSTKVTDAELKTLKEFKSLQYLNLGNTTTTDVGLKELKQLETWRTLYLWRPEIRDAGLKELKKLKGLQRLVIWGTKITDAGLRQLKELKSLQQLNLTATKVTSAGLKELKGFT